VIAPLHPAKFTFIDLFAGIGGFHAAMQAEGGECVFACEIDAACRDVYESNWGMRPAGDIRPITEGRDVDVPAHDVLCAGFPCQPFSKSGFQRGMEETRGTLFFNILRILEARRPRYAILENVRNLAGPRQRSTWDTIIRNLRSLGYRVSYEPAVFSPHLLSPGEGGRPQVRERVFLLCTHVGAADEGSTLDEAPLVTNQPVNGWDKSQWRIEDWLQDDADIADPTRYALRDDEVRWIEAWDDFVKRVDEDPLPGFPVWVDAFTTRPRLRANMPDWEENFRRKNSAFYMRHRKVLDAWVERHGVRSFPPSRRKFEWQARGWPRDLWSLVLHLRPSGIRVKGPTYLPALVAITQTSIVGSRRRRLTTRECARLQGFEDNFVLHADDRVAYRQLGNAVNVGAVSHVARRLMASGGGRLRRLRASQGKVQGVRLRRDRTSLVGKRHSKAQDLKARR
jgi:DNA (cytosine-5)-methyltransferase 1